MFQTPVPPAHAPLNRRLINLLADTFPGRRDLSKWKVDDLSTRIVLFFPLTSLCLAKARSIRNKGPVYSPFSRGPHRRKEKNDCQLYCAEASESFTFFGFPSPLIALGRERTVDESEFRPLRSFKCPNTDTNHSRWGRRADGTGEIMSWWSEADHSASKINTKSWEEFCCSGR